MTGAPSGRSSRIRTGDEHRHELRYDQLPTALGEARDRGHRLRHVPRATSRPRGPPVPALHARRREPHGLLPPRRAGHPGPPGSRGDRRSSPCGTTRSSGTARPSPRSSPPTTSRPARAGSPPSANGCPKRDAWKPISFQLASGITPHLTAVHMTWGAVNEWTTQAAYARLAKLAGHPTLSRAAPPDHEAGGPSHRLLRRPGQVDGWPTAGPPNASPVGPDATSGPRSAAA